MWKRFVQSLPAAWSALVMSLMVFAVLIEILGAVVAIAPSMTMKDFGRPVSWGWFFGSGLFIIATAFRAARRDKPAEPSQNRMMARVVVWSWRTVTLLATMLLIAAMFACISADWRSSIAGRLAGERMFQELPTRVWISRLERNEESATEHAILALAYADGPADQEHLKLHAEMLVPRLVEIIRNPRWPAAELPKYGMTILGRIGP
ncbi:MAG: hypothetical protein KDB01_23065, partial [Planctomycetaceae bacterium]|nr:hypothetical protein [Planctomycetaceae bacterium]